MTTLNGMTYGLFATLIIGVIIQQIGRLLNIELLHTTVYLRLAGLMGAGIGLGIGLTLKMEGLKLVVAGVMGGIATSFRLTFTNGLELVQNNEPLTVYLVVVFGLLLLNLILRKKTPVDILLIPLLGVFIAIVLTLGISAPMRFLVDTIQIYVHSATAYAPFFMSIVIAVIMGMLLTSPLSSAAIAITINLSGVAGGAAVIGTTAQMIGFAVQSRKDNNIGMVLSIAFGTSMLQFKNILRKPMIWLPTIITSAILGPIFVLMLGTTTTKEGAGMGSSGFVGQLQTLFHMNYSGMAWLSVGLMIALSATFVFAIDLIFRKMNWIVEGDLAVNNDISGK
ncbi:MAG: PTS sugar transporter subunit IIC, partial [Acholeplasmataceae bacterium]|nr:PTS sugar transporter subunit IIC [Acholeplasmataceae bacterium]